MQGLLPRTKQHVQVRVLQCQVGCTVPVQSHAVVPLLQSVNFHTDGGLT